MQYVVDQWKKLFAATPGTFRTTFSTTFAERYIYSCSVKSHVILLHCNSMSHTLSLLTSLHRLIPVHYSLSAVSNTPNWRPAKTEDFQVVTRHITVGLNLAHPFKCPLIGHVCLNRDWLESNLRLPKIKGCLKNARHKGFGTSADLLCLV